MLMSPAIDASSAERVRPEPVTPFQSMAVAPVPDSVFNCTEPLFTDPLIPGMPVRLALSDSPSKPNHVLSLEGSESAANLMDADVTVMPNAEVPRVSDCEPLTVIEPASSGALVSAGVMTVTSVRVTLKLAEPLRMLKALMLTSPATLASSPLSVRPEPVTPFQWMAVAPTPDSVFSWTTPLVTEPLMPGTPVRPALSDSPSKPNQLLSL